MGITQPQQQQQQQQQESIMLAGAVLRRTRNVSNVNHVLRRDFSVSETTEKIIKGGVVAAGVGVAAGLVAYQTYSKSRLAREWVDKLNKSYATPHPRTYFTFYSRSSSEEE